MNIPKLGGLIKVAKTFLIAKRPEILLGTAVIGAVSGAALGAKGGYEARGIIDAERMRRVASPEPPFDTFLEYYEDYINSDAGELTSKEKIQLTWLCYIPATIAVSGSIGSVAGLHLVHVKDKKQLAMALSAAVEEGKEALEQYASDVDDNLTPAQREKLNEKMREKAEADGGAFVDGEGHVVEKYLVRDNWTGRDIYTNKQEIEDAVNQINASISEGADMELNTFYGLAGFDPVENGDELGWSGELIKLKWGSDVRKDNRPVVTFGFRTPPTVGYDRRR